MAIPFNETAERDKFPLLRFFTGRNFGPLHRLTQGNRETAGNGKFGLRSYFGSFGSVYDDLP